LPVSLLIAIWLAPREQTFAWCCGSIIAISSTFNLMFLFQGLEKLPLYGTVSLFSSIFSALAFFSFKPGMVMGSDLVVLAISGLLSVIINTLIIKRISGAGIGRVTDVDIKSLLMESRPYWTLGLVVFCYSNLQVPLVGYMADEESVGVYRSAVMLAAGLDLLYSSVNSLLLPRLVTWKEFGAAYLWNRQIELAKISFVAGFAVSFLIILTAPLIYQYILGVQFNGAVLPFQILVVGRMVVFVGQVFAWSLSALKLDRAFLKASLAGAGFSLVANAILVPSFGIVAAALVSVFAEILVHGMCYYFVRRYTLNKI
jgi:O-antigen/teichoic acid export membrane protein